MGGESFVLVIFGREKGKRGGSVKRKRGELEVAGRGELKGDISGHSEGMRELCIWRVEEVLLSH